MNNKMAVLIPAFKTEYIRATINSVFNQTHSPELIVISDDSADNIVTQNLKSYLKDYSALASRVVFLEGPKQGGAANMIYLLEEYENTGYGLYHLLSDDDIIAPTFYEAHHWILSEVPGSQISLSKRSVIGEDNLPINCYPYPPQITQSPDRKLLLSPEILYKSTVPSNINWLGEYSNCIFRKQVARQSTRSLLHNIPYYGLNDIGFFLEMSETHPIAFVNDYLGAFRISAQANSANKNLNVVKWGVFAWMAIAISAWSNGYLSDDDLSTCASKVLKNHAGIYGEHNSELIETVRSVARLEVDSPARFVVAWYQSLAGFIEGQKYLQHIEALEETDLVMKICK
jgi:hypothetical protein